MRSIKAQPAFVGTSVLHARSVEGFCIVSSDSDYTGLASRIQETGLEVYGFGQRDTAASFVAACDEFFFWTRRARRPRRR